MPELSRRSEKRAKGLLGPFAVSCQKLTEAKIALLIFVGWLLVRILIAVTVDGTHTRSVLIPIIVGDYTSIRRYSVSIQVLVGVCVCLDRRVATVASSRQSNRRKQACYNYDSIHSVLSRIG